MKNSFCSFRDNFTRTVKESRKLHSRIHLNFYSRPKFTNALSSKFADRSLDEETHKKRAWKTQTRLLIFFPAQGISFIRFSLFLFFPWGNKFSLCGNTKILLVQRFKKGNVLHSLTLLLVFPFGGCEIFFARDMFLVMRRRCLRCDRRGGDFSLPNNDFLLRLISLSRYHNLILKTMGRKRERRGCVSEWERALLEKSRWQFYFIMG